jgi:ubiquinone/menaquinone biosynthesis C-methylase UbiE
MSASRAVYTHGHHESVLRSHRWRTAENSAAYLLPHLRPGMSLLDVGCGPGTITADLADLVAPGTVTAVENAPDVLAVARSAIRSETSASTGFVVSDVHSLGFADDTFDVVHAHQVLQHVVDPVLALEEMRRVCAPRGVVGVRDSDYGAFTWYPEVPELDEWLRLYRRLARQNRGEPDAGRRLLAWAHRAGFTDVQVGSSTWCFATPEDRAWWSQTWAERVLGSRFAEQALSSGLATRADLQRLADGWRTWADDADAWFSLLHGEIVARS